MKHYLPHLYSWLGSLIICSVLLIGCNESNGQSQTNITNTPTNQAQGTLPGEQTWKNGASSYIFGTNDTGEWNAPNIEFTDSLTAPGKPNTTVQSLVKQAGFTLMRKFIGHHNGSNGEETTDSALQAISNTMSNTGTQCLINIFSIDPSNTSKKAGDSYTDLQFAQHIVTLFDGHHAGFIKCSLFEIGNEPDTNGLDASHYLTVWNTFVSALKQLRPDAQFIGPVTTYYNPDYVQAFLQGIVQNHYPVPNALSWHWYPCGGGPDAVWSTCLSDSMGQMAQETTEMRTRTQSILGYQLPLGITEWSADPGGNMSSTGPEMSQFVRQTLQAMIDAKLDFANQFDMQSFAAYGGLDMIDQHNAPKPYFYAFSDVISQYKL